MGDRGKFGMWGRGEISELGGQGESSKVRLFFLQ